MKNDNVSLFIEGFLATNAIIFFIWAMIGSFIEPSTKSSNDWLWFIRYAISMIILGLYGILRLIRIHSEK